MQNLHTLWKKCGISLIGGGRNLGYSILMYRIGARAGSFNCLSISSLIPCCNWFVSNVCLQVISNICPCFKMLVYMAFVDSMGFGESILSHCAVLGILILWCNWSGNIRIYNAVLLRRGSVNSFFFYGFVVKKDIQSE